MSQYDNVSVVKIANIYFDGMCVSHTLLFPDGTKKSLGVIFPSQLRFKTQAAEIMDINAGLCKVKQKDAKEWKEYKAGDSFNVPAESYFDIETLETLDYVCHFV